MDERKDKTPAKKLNDEALDEVAGGAPCFNDPDSTCPNCGQWNVPVWSS